VGEHCVSEYEFSPVSGDLCFALHLTLHVCILQDLIAKAVFGKMFFILLFMIIA